MKMKLSKRSATLDLSGVLPWTPEEEAAERAYIAEYVTDPRLRRWIATLDAARSIDEGLDVERLAASIHQGERDMDPYDRPFCPSCLADAQRYAREYAALAAAPENKP